MLSIHKSPEAENDLDEIWWYIAQDNPVSADKQSCPRHPAFSHPQNRSVPFYAVGFRAPFQFVNGPEVFLLLLGERRGEAADSLLLQDQVARVPLK